MAGEENVRDAFFLTQSLEYLHALYLDATGRIGFGIEIEQLVEKNILDGKPGHVAPHVERYGLDLGITLFRISLTQIVDRQPVPPHFRAENARDFLGQIKRFFRWQAA